jgi:putative hemolysin
MINKRSITLFILLTVALLIVCGCNTSSRQTEVVSSLTPPLQTNTVNTDEKPQAGIANPSSVYCVKLGYQSEIRKDEAGNEFGVCVFPDNSECDEWAFFRGECQPGQNPASTLLAKEDISGADICPSPEPGTLLHVEQNSSGGPGYCFHYPETMEVSAMDNQEGITIMKPAPDGGAMPGQPGVSIQVIDLAGMNFQQYVEEKIAEISMGAAIKQQTVSPGALSNVVIVEGYPAQINIRVMYVEHNGYIYELTFFPSDPENLPQETAEMENLYKILTASWRFMD